MSDEHDDVVDNSKLERTSISSLRTRSFGIFTVHGFRFKPTNEEIFVLTLGEVSSLEAPLVKFIPVALLVMYLAQFYVNVVSNSNSRLRKSKQRAWVFLFTLNKKAEGRV